MSEKKFAGIARKVETQYGPLVKVAFRKDDLNTLVKWFKDNPDEEWVKVNLKEKREPKNDWTHYGEIDEWKPTAQATPDEGSKMEEGSDDLPF